MRRLLVFLLLLVAGCSQGPSLSRYLANLDPFQKDLQSYQTELKGLINVPVEHRKEAGLRLADKVAARHKELDGLEVPPKAAALHSKMQGLYATLEEFARKAASSTGQPNDPELARLSQQWAKQLGEADQELNRLSK